MSKPSLGFTPSKLHGHLGHFTQDRFLRDGHNTSPAPRRKVVGSYAPGVVTVQKRGGGEVRRDVDNLAARTAKRAIRQGNAAVAAERPVLAAKVAARQRMKEARRSGEAGAVKQARQLNRASVRTARTSVDSARHERKARRQGA
jgi:hypothetical protein